MEDPSSGSTLLEISRVLSDKAFRQMKLERCKNPIIKQFWENAEKRIEQWENPLTIIEMIALDSEEMDDEDFDRPV